MMESENRKIDSQLAYYIWKIIDDSGLTHQAVADGIEKSLRVVNMYCSGARKPNQVTLLKILKITNATIEDIPF